MSILERGRAQGAGVIQMTIPRSMKIGPLLNQPRMDLDFDNQVPLWGQT